MKVLISLMFLVVSGFASLSLAEKKSCDEDMARTEPSSENQFGAPLKLQTNPITVEEAIAKVSTADKAPLLLTATIDKVCKKKGCWMSIKGKEKDLRVVFKDYAFFVPFDIAGKKILTEGILTAKKLSLAETKHYIADEGGDPSKVTEPMTDYQFVASGVKIIE